MKQLRFKQYDDEIVRDLADKLLRTNQDDYMVTRECLILRFGYEQFRDIQCEAFDLILSQSGMSQILLLSQNDTSQNETFQNEMSQNENSKISK
jgi:hypothetical protein